MATPGQAAQPHVVIVGGGFGGIYAARELARAPVRVTLVDRRNHHLFQPLLYQVATAALTPDDIAEPIRHVLSRQANARVLMAEAAAVEPEARRLRLGNGLALDYDYLVVAAGATHSYFGNDQWERHAPGLKTIEDALEIRSRVFLAFEAAERETDPERRREWLTFVIVGAGPTGVELAGTLGEIARDTLEGDFRSIDPSESRILLLDAAPRLLGRVPERDLRHVAAPYARILGRHVLRRDREAIPRLQPRLPRREFLQQPARALLQSLGRRVAHRRPSPASRRAASRWHCSCALLSCSR